MSEETLSGSLSLRGYARWEHRRNGELIDIREVPNIIVQEGRQQAAGLLNGATTARFTYIAIGTSTTAVTSTDTTLGTEITTTSGGALRASATCTRTSGTLANDTMQNLKMWTFTTESTGYSIGESGVFASSSSGPMLCHQVFSAISVVGNDTLTVTWKVLTSATS